MVQSISRAKKTIGSRAEVFHGTAVRTAGGLAKSDLTKSKWGKIVSKKKQKLGRALAKSFPTELTKAPAFQKTTRW